MVAELLAEGARRLERVGIEGAARDARRILAGLLDVDVAKLAIMDTPLPNDRELAFWTAIDNRQMRMPVSHVLGWREFWGRRFIVNRSVLDPRPETETLIEKALNAPFSRVLDLGTGSGCIIVTLLAERPEATGVGTDISPEGILVAGDNAEQIGVADRLILPLSEWYDDIGGRFDLIVSNPPYIAAHEMDDLAPEVRDHEPRIALTDEADGLTAYLAIAAGAQDHLTPDGRLLVEIGPTQAEDVTAIFAAAGLDVVAAHPDLDGRDRVVEARLKSA